MLISMDNLAWTLEWQGRRMRIVSRWLRLPITGLWHWISLSWHASHGHSNRRASLRLKHVTYVLTETGLTVTGIATTKQ